MKTEPLKIKVETEGFNETIEKMSQIKKLVKETVDLTAELQSRLNELTCRTLLTSAQNGDENSANAIKALCGNHGMSEK